MVRLFDNCVMCMGFFDNGVVSVVTRLINYRIMMVVRFFDNRVVMVMVNVCFLNDRIIIVIDICFLNYRVVIVVDICFFNERDICVSNRAVAARGSFGRGFCENGTVGGCFRGVLNF